MVLKQGAEEGNIKVYGTYLCDCAFDRMNLDDLALIFIAIVSQLEDLWKEDILSGYKCPGSLLPSNRLLE